MKFGQELASVLTPEWRKHYIDYELLKEKLYERKDELGDPAIKEKIHNEFMELCISELKKINYFFISRLAETQEKFNELTHDLQEMRVQNDKFHEKKTAQKIKAAFSEFYLSLCLLQKYQYLNHRGFQKICKKRDKLLKDMRGMEWHNESVDGAEFHTNKMIDVLVQEVETMMTNLEGGDKKAAMNRLKLPPIKEKDSPWVSFRVGVVLGCILAMLILAAINWVSYMSDSESKSEPKWVAVRLFRGSGIFILYLWLIALNVYGWDKAGVNHVLIFEIDPRKGHITYQNILEMAAMLSFVWTTCVLMFTYHPFVTFMPVYAWPLVVWLVLFVGLINPIKCFYRPSRWWLLSRLSSCILSPFYHVRFSDFWLADQMGSLVTAMLDLDYTVCFYATELDYSDWSVHNLTDVSHGVNYATGESTCTSNLFMLRPMIAAFPGFLRCVQCLRRYKDLRTQIHWVNTVKYGSVVMVVVFGTMHNISGLHAWWSPFLHLWIGCYLWSFVTTFWWDVCLDWGFFKWHQKNNKFLRDELIYDNKAWYYLAIVGDCILRLSWVFTVSIGVGVIDWEKEAVQSVTAPLECVRRCVWNQLRLENEHLFNCGQFRATRDISFKPMKRAVGLDERLAMLNLKRNKNNNKPNKTPAFLRNLRNRLR